MLAAIGLVAGWFTLIWGFVLAMHVKHLRDSGVKMSLFWLVNLAPIAAVGVLLDFAFNVAAGTLMYLELPPFGLVRVRGVRFPFFTEPMFTSRCKRWVKVDDEETSELWLYRRGIARWWQRQLNQISPGHV